jgi:hypothetical protein
MLPCWVIALSIYIDMLLTELMKLLLVVHPSLFYRGNILTMHPTLACLADVFRVSDLYFPTNEHRLGQLSTRSRRRREQSGPHWIAVSCHGEFT